jgi:hypothetical protein
LGTFLVLTNHAIRKAAFLDLFRKHQNRQQISDVILFTDTNVSVKTKLSTLKCWLRKLKRQKWKLWF